MALAQPRSQVTETADNLTAQERGTKNGALISPWAINDG